MAKLLYTVDDLVSEIRSLLDENNTDSVSTSVDILPALNRAQDYAWDIYARRYPSPILKQATLDLTANTQDYTIPEDCYQDRVLHIDIAVATGAAGTSYDPLERIDPTSGYREESTAAVAAPSKYYIHGRYIRVIPASSGTFDGRIFYVREPDKLVLSQGRITAINTGSNYITVDAIGSSISTTADNIANYLNIIDGQTGEIKRTMQVSSTSSSDLRVTFRSSLSRSTVLGRTVSTTIGSDAAVDDYICLVQGTCVPYFGSPTVNFLTQFAVAQIAPRKGTASGLEEDRLLERFEKQIGSTWSGRETTMRITPKSRVWR